MYKLIIQKRAILNITKIVEYIREDNLFYANKVQEYIKQSISLLSDFPFLGTPINSTHRKIVEPNYKFKIIYKIKGDNVYIVGVYKEQKSW